MPFINDNGKEIEEASSKLKQELKAQFDTSRDKKCGDKLFDLLENFIDAKIRKETDDLDNKINKRGIYDPEW